jgi:hypothetical protein
MQFIALFFLVVYILTLGTHAPIPLYEWLLESPVAGIVWLFRDPFRLVQFTVLAFSFLLSFTIYRLVEIRLKLKDALIILLAVAVIASPSAYTFFNAAGNRLIPSQVPSDYEQVRTFLQSDDGAFKVLWLPLRQYQYYDWNNVDNDVAGDLYSASSPVPTYALTTTSNNLQFWNYFYTSVILDYRSEYVGKMLSVYEVKYVIVHTDLLQWQKGEAEKVLTVLGYQKDMALTQSFGQYHVFLNLDYVEDSHLFSVSHADNYQPSKALPLLATPNYSLEIGNATRWTNLSNSQLSEDPVVGALKWDVTFLATQERYEVRLPIDNANFEDYDKLAINVMPVGDSEPEFFAVALYTNSSNFLFTRHDLDHNLWNEEIFDLRGAKIGQASDSNLLNLKNVTGIGIVVYKQYYPIDRNYSFYVREINLIPESIPYSTNAVQSDLIANKPSNVDLQVLSQEPAGYRLKLSTSEPVVLTLSESYDPLWEAQINGIDKAVGSQPVHYISNGFVIGTPGDYEIEIHYGAQSWLHYGLIMTFVTIGIVSSWLIFNNKRRRPATKSREVSDIHLLEKRRSGSNYLCDLSVMTTLSI